MKRGEKRNKQPEYEPVNVYDIYEPTDTYPEDMMSSLNEIHYFVIDFFNDLTGMDRYAERLWDVQSKAARNNSPLAVGQSLVTLFKNYISDISFANYILFLGGVSSTLRIDDKINVFGIDNLRNDAKSKVTAGLKAEALGKVYIENAKVTDDNIQAFLNTVIFVIDDKEPCDYVREIIKNHPAILPENKILTAVFNEIRDAQSEKKNTLVEGVTIQTTDEALNYCRHLTNSEIKLLTLHRIINRNPVEKSLPLSFVPIYNAWPPERQKEMWEECIQSLCRALFNKNAADSFWTLFEHIYKIVADNPTYGVQEMACSQNM